MSTGKTVLAVVAVGAIATALYYLFRAEDVEAPEEQQERVRVAVQEMDRTAPRAPGDDTVRDQGGLTVHERKSLETNFAGYSGTAEDRKAAETKFLKKLRAGLV